MSTPASQALARDRFAWGLAGLLAATAHLPSRIHRALSDAARLASDAARIEALISPPTQDPSAGAPGTSTCNAKS